MAKRSRTEITQSLGLISWLYWQVLRRQRNYAAAVVSCKRRWEFELHNSKDPLRRFAAEQALCAMCSLEGYRWRYNKRLDEIAVSMMIDQGMRHVTDLDDFVRTWQIRFPVPPSIPELPSGELLTSSWCVPVKLVNPNRQRVVLQVYPDVGMEILAAHIRGALLHFAAKRKGVK